MIIKIYWLGKTKKDFVSIANSEYLKRISGHTKIKIIELTDIKLTKAINIDIVKAKEAEIIRKAIKTEEYLIVLDERGDQFTSPEFAKFLDKQASKGTISFLIGGTYGLDKTIIDRADLILSFSKMTFTHQMIRIILLEQIYRSITIIKKKKYHY